MSKILDPPDILEYDINEIVSEIPGWTSRWGITAIFAFFACALIISSFVKYPDIIRAKVVITTSPAPITVQAKISGTLKLLKEENSNVLKNEVVAYVQTSESYEDVLRVSRMLTDREELPEENLQLGILQTFYNSFRIAAREESLILKSALIPQQISSLKNEILLNKTLRENLDQELKILKDELCLARERLQRDSLLFSTGAISANDYNLAKASYAQHHFKYRSALSTLTNNDIRDGALRSQIAGLDADRVEKLQRASLAALNAKHALQAEIAKWIEQHVFTAPTDGKLSFLKFLEQDIFISAQDEIFAVVPAVFQIYAQSQIPIDGSGKIRLGQPVNIKLDNYPYQEYGIIEGCLVHLSTVPFEQSYLGKIAIDKDLKTTYGKKLLFKPQLQGQTEIITDEKSVLDRIFYQLRALVVQ